jgi:hypothetical protein
MFHKLNKLATENTGINTQRIMGKMGNTWRGWRQAQREVKQISV